MFSGKNYVQKARTACTSLNVQKPIRLYLQPVQSSLQLNIQFLSKPFQYYTSIHA